MHRLFLLFALLCCTAANAQTSSDSACAAFHNGKFYVQGMTNITVERDSTTQIERNALDGTYVKMSVTWTGDCTYELRLLESNRKGEKKDWKKMKVLVVNITYTEGDSYRFSAFSPAFPEPVRGTLVRKGK